MIDQQLHEESMFQAKEFLNSLLWFHAVDREFVHQQEAIAALINETKRMMLVRAVALDYLTTEQVHKILSESSWAEGRAGYEEQVTKALNEAKEES